MTSKYLSSQERIEGRHVMQGLSEHARTCRSDLGKFDTFPDCPRAGVLADIDIMMETLANWRKQVESGRVAGRLPGQGG